jgi:hypothetical protein
VRHRTKIAARKPTQTRVAVKRTRIAVG